MKTPLVPFSSYSYPAQKSIASSDSISSAIVGLALQHSNKLWANMVMRKPYSTPFPYIAATAGSTRISCAPQTIDPY